MFTLTPLQHDALCELFNLGVGQAAAVMSQIVHEPIELSVPHIEFVDASHALLKSDDGSAGICGVSQRFAGQFPGVALLMFPQQQSLEIVRLMMQDNVPLEQLTELEQDALLEVGNILLNVCISSLSDMLAIPMQSDLPELYLCGSHDILSDLDWHDSTVMLLQIRFSVEHRSIDGQLAFILSMPSLEQLRMALDRYLGQIPGAL